MSGRLGLRKKKGRKPAKIMTHMGPGPCRVGLVVIGKANGGIERSAPGVEANQKQVRL